LFNDGLHHRGQTPLPRILMFSRLVPCFIL
jgi:hypothetical protein